MSSNSCTATATATASATICLNLQFRHCTSSLRPPLIKFNLPFNPQNHLSLSPKPISTSPPPSHVRITPLTSMAAAAAAASSSSSTTRSVADQKPFSVLFVCLGNICRSPAAEAVFRDLVQKKGLQSHFIIDSAGTIGYHEGDPADSRMRAASKRRGIEVTSISRSLRPSDFKDFDLILAMDMQNRDDILSAYERWGFKETLPVDAQKKVKLMCSYCRKHKETEVPDPYYGGPKGFEKVLDLLEDACGGLLDNILAENNNITTS